MTKTHTGGCQCGAVRYEVEADIKDVIACNCSRCGKLGSLLAFVPMQKFKLVVGEKATTDYRFNKHVIHHLFCATCGIESYAKGTNPKGEAMIAINARCLDDIDLSSLNVKNFDGKALG